MDNWCLNPWDLSSGWLVHWGGLGVLLLWVQTGLLWTEGSVRSISSGLDKRTKLPAVTGLPAVKTRSPGLWPCCPFNASLGICLLGRICLCPLWDWRDLQARRCVNVPAAEDKHSPLYWQSPDCFPDLSVPWRFFGWDGRCFIRRRESAQFPCLTTPVLASLWGGAWLGPWGSAGLGAVAFLFRPLAPLP